MAPFNVCWLPVDGTTTRLLDGDALQQQVNTQVAESATGNVRTAGPKPPMRGLPERHPASVQRGGYRQFIHGLTFGAGWVQGAPTNLWIVGFTPG